MRSKYRALRPPLTTNTPLVACTIEGHSDTTVPFPFSPAPATDLNRGLFVHVRVCPHSKPSASDVRSVVVRLTALLAKLITSAKLAAIGLPPSAPTAMGPNALAMSSARMGETGRTLTRIESDKKY